MMKKWILTGLSASFLLSNMLVSPIYAEQSTELSKETSEEMPEEITEDLISDKAIDLKAIGETNPLTEEELLMAIQPLNDYDDNAFYEMEELRTMVVELYDLLVERQASGEEVTQEEIQETYGDPIDISDSGSSEFYKYIALEDLIMLEIDIQFYDSGEGFILSNFEVIQTIPRSYEALEITTEELDDLANNAQDISEFVQVLGPVHQIQYTMLSYGVMERASWIDGGYPWRDNVDTEFRVITIEDHPGEDGFRYAVREINPSNDEESTSEEQAATEESDSEESSQE